MRDYGKVHSKFWSSPTTGGLSDDGKLLAVYLLSCQHSTIAGVFRLPDGYAAEDLGWTVGRVAKGFDELSSKGFVARCELTKWVWVIKHLEWNPPENPNQRKAAAKVVQLIPAECTWRLRFHRASWEALELDEPEESDGCETLAEPFLNQEQEQEQKQKQEQKKAAAQPLDAASQTAVDDGADPVHLKDWIKARKSPLTKTAWEGLKAEAEKAGITPGEAVRICAVKGWRGFDSSWNWRGPPGKTPPADTNARDAEIRRLMNKQHGEIIDV